MIRTVCCVTALALVTLSPAFAAPDNPRKQRDVAAKPAAPARPVASFWTSAEPTFDERTYDRINAAMLSYSAIEVRGGWPTVSKVNLDPGASGPDVAKLRARLAVTEDLPPELAAGDAYDQMLTEAVKRFQARHGLPETGTVGPQTIEALNVPVKQRIKQLAASLDRLQGMGFTFGQRYVVVNIPAAVAEAVENGKVARRYVTVVGKIERPSPTLTTTITEVNLNPTWTVPLSIVKKDIVPKMRKDPNYASRMNMKLLDSAGNEIDPRSIDWQSDRTPSFMIRQDSGDSNALGNVRINMPNSVFGLHARHQPSQSVQRGLSLPVLGLYAREGCARPRGLDPEGQCGLGPSRDRRRDRDAEAHHREARAPHPGRVDLPDRLGEPGRHGRVQERRVWAREQMSRPLTVDVGRPQRSAARESGFILQSDDPEPMTFAPVSYLDSR